jgi:molybdopterin-synthase adenylyltransferase
MSQSRISMLGSQESALVRFLESHPVGHERAAVVLFRRLSINVPGLERSDRYVAIDVIPLEESWVTSSSGAHVAFELKYFRELFRRCEEESLVFGFVHNHPGGPADFSDVDEENERTLTTAIRNRNGTDAHFVAMLWSQGTWKARVRCAMNPAASEPARHVLIVDRPLRLHLNATRRLDDELFARQAAAFGQPFVEQFQSLRIAVVGAGGTGSPTLTLLARAGAGEIVVVDGDKLERSNLNRVRGANASDVGRNKALIQKGFLESLGLPVRVAAFDTHVDLNPEAVDALASCDVLFGCTDDQIGREILNTCVYIYGQAYIDVGLGGQIAQDKQGRPYLRYHFGRVSTILPEGGECLFCQGVLKDVWIRHQYAIRQDPQMTASNARERYLEHGGEQAPGVGPFTSAVADYGVGTLFDLLRPFRKFRPELRADFFKIDFVQMELTSSQQKSDADCIYCGQRMYLLRAESYRLNRPALGKRNAAV